MMRQIPLTFSSMSHAKTNALTDLEQQGFASTAKNPSPKTDGGVTPIAETTMNGTKTPINVMMKSRWNTTLPPVEVNVLLALYDGTIWKVKRADWLNSRDDDPHYQCVTTGHALPLSDVIGWRYP